MPDERIIAHPAPSPHDAGSDGYVDARVHGRAGRSPRAQLAPQPAEQSVSPGARAAAQRLAVEQARLAQQKQQSAPPPRGRDGRLLKRGCGMMHATLVTRAATARTMHALRTRLARSSLAGPMAERERTKEHRAMKCLHDNKPTVCARRLAFRALPKHAPRRSSASQAQQCSCAVCKRCTEARSAVASRGAHSARTAAGVRLVDGLHASRAVQATSCALTRHPRRLVLRRESSLAKDGQQRHDCAGASGNAHLRDISPHMPARAAL
jgi:hypothetical protein